MPRGFKRDDFSTKRAYELGIFRDKKKRSFLSLPKPSEHGDVHELLDGDDMGPRRHQVYERDKGICKHCKAWTAEDAGDMCHREDKAGKRCDCLGNLYWAHGWNSGLSKPNCHFIHDHPERL